MPELRAESPVRLSICIPTYNFGAFIGETLESLLPQAPEGVEVVVLDGGSTDNTTELVRPFEERFPALRYHRREERGGIDRDLARTVDLARGEYVWLFCSDDVMKPGALSRMLDNIRSAHDVYVCGFTLCTFDMHPLRDAPIMQGASEAEFDLGDAVRRQAYFEQAQTTPAFFSFAGSLIFRKSVWDSVSLDEAFVGSCWAHVARFFALMPDGLRLRSLPDSYLYKRSENDSFMDRGLARRYALAIDGYNRLASTFFGDESIESQEIRRVIRNEFPPWSFLIAKLECLRDGRAEDVPLLDRLAATTYRDRSLKNRIYGLIYRHTPVTAFRSALATYRALRAALQSLKPRERARHTSAAVDGTPDDMCHSARPPR
jgi:O-antigen biosynthesis alpha-1,3-abequosyltransferase